MVSRSNRTATEPSLVQGTIASQSRKGLSLLIKQPELAESNLKSLVSPHLMEQVRYRKYTTFYLSIPE